MVSTGVHRIAARSSRATLLFLNYHRIRDPGRRETRFDDGVFDTDLETFRRQMRWLRSATQILDEEDLLRFSSGKRLPVGATYAAVTFDDGYIDCHTLAKPVLDELGIKGIFFIPVEILATRRLGWWDIAAYLLKRTTRQTITVDDQVYSPREDLARTLRRILNSFKLDRSDQTEGLLTKLSDACGVPLPSKDEQSAELMDWTHVCELRDSGHAIGSHAWSHRVLATLSPGEQSREILDSRRELRAIVGTEILSFAYPVGGPQHFDERSVALVQQAGYQQAFTFNTGVSTGAITDRFRIPRESATSFAALRAKALLPGVMGLRSKHAV
jgi:peptidoglycan/xylan/chitin deacetylase (PgdA/CDA1 family)